MKTYMAANMQCSIRSKAEDDHMQNTMNDERNRQAIVCREDNSQEHRDLISTKKLEK